MARGEYKKDMTVAELIARLQKSDGSKKVSVQFRDGGGDYDGEDDTLYLIEEDDRIVL